MEHGLLKNYHKFKYIKFTPAINLQNFSTRKRTEKSEGVSIVKYGKVWFKVNGNLALFKTYDGKGYKTGMKNIRMANELICANLAQQINIESAKYETATNGTDSGLISYNFLKPKQKLLSLFHFLAPNIELDSNLVDISEKINEYTLLGYEIDKETVIFDLYKYLIFDALTLQTDRHSENVNFILDKANHSLKIAPMIDNEFAFNIENLDELNNQNELITYQKLLINYSEHSKTLDVRSELSGTPKRHRHNIENIIDIAKANPKMMDYLLFALKKLNIKKAIADTEQMGIQISEDYKEYITKIIQHTKRMVLQELNHTKDRPSTGLYEEYIK